MLCSHFHFHFHFIFDVGWDDVFVISFLANRRERKLETGDGWVEMESLVSASAAGLGDDTLHVLDLGLTTAESSEL